MEFNNIFKFNFFLNFYKMATGQTNSAGNPCGFAILQKLLSDQSMADIHILVGADGTLKRRSATTNFGNKINRYVKYIPKLAILTVFSVKKVFFSMFL